CGRGLSELFLSPVAPSAPACAPCGATPHPARLRPTTLPPAGGEGGAVTLDPFYPIVDSADWVRRLVGVGARLVQLRMKDKDDAKVAAEARAALKICRDAGATSSSTTSGASRSTSARNGCISARATSTQAPMSARSAAPGSSSD